MLAAEEVDHPDRQNVRLLIDLRLVSRDDEELWSESLRLEGSANTTEVEVIVGVMSTILAEALADACRRISDYGPDALVVSLGVDTFEHDPISFFKLTSEDFIRYGELIGRLGRPTLFVLEGGYAVAEIGVNAVNVLTGFEQVA